MSGAASKPPTKKRPRLSSSTDHPRTKKSTTTVTATPKLSPQEPPRPPNPPPPPPASLVRLIRKDPKVLHYFQALQANLSWDVKKWKQKARMLQAEKDKLLPQQQQQQEETQPPSHPPPPPPRLIGNESIEQKRNAQESMESREAVANDNDHDNNKQPLAMTSTWYSANLESSSSSSDDDDDPDTWFSLDSPIGLDTTTSPMTTATDMPADTSDLPHESTTAAAPQRTKTKRPLRSSFGIHRRNKPPSTTNSGDWSSSSDDDHDDEDDNDHLVNDPVTGQSSPRTAMRRPTTTATPTSTVKTSHTRTNSPQHASLIMEKTLQQLSNVYDDLEELGIPLLEQQTQLMSLTEPHETISTIVPDNESMVQQQQGTDNTQSNTATTTTAVRRSDQQVATSIIQFLKALSKIKHVMASESSLEDSMKLPASLRPSGYYPFMSSTATISSEENPHDDLLPCYMRIESVTEEWQHPAVSGMQRLMTCLCWMDVLCPALNDTNHQDCWELFLVSSTDKTTTRSTSTTREELKKIFLAFQGRKTLINELLQSIHGEIVDTWAVEDRTTRLQADSTQLDPEDAVASSKLSSSTTDHAEGGCVGEDDIEEQKEKATGTDSIKVALYGSKNHIRLCTLLERCLHARLVITLYLTRGDAQSALQLLWAYVHSTVPCRSVEDYPRLAPVQSFCVMEAMLTASVPPSLRSAKDPTGHSTLLNWMERTNSRDTMSASMFEVLALTFQCTAAIYRDRNMPHMDDRITDISRIELGAYTRLTTASHILGVHVGTVQPLQELNRLSQNHAGPPACQLLGMLVRGDADSLDAMITMSLSKIQEGQESTTCHDEFLACISAKREFEIRQLDTYRRLVNTRMIFTPSHTGKAPLQKYSEELIHLVLEKDFSSVPMSTVIAASRSCHVTGDGLGLFQLASWCLTAMSEKPHNASFVSLMGVLESSSGAVTIRVINLKRRPDRLASFMSQAILYRLSVMKGVADLHDSSCPPNGANQLPYSAFGGGFGIDGQGKPAEVEQRLIDLVGGNPEDLNRLVEKRWFPNELKPFDIDAPSVERSVLISSSEKACSLSHIACWKGVERSLSKVPPTSPLDGRRALRDVHGLRQRFLVSGYARGPTLSGESMDPTPVCIILEDDAILVDRFTDRLECVLNELPRDFHFCSLGYSRPKTAPLVPFSDHVCIPTSIWYLTGYILSLEGAKFLLGKLPVRGPVDSWIGLTMFTQNWDNVFGHALGVGVSSKPPQDPAVSRPNLKRILRFKAFAAATPLCSQRVGHSSSDLGGMGLSSSTGRKSWRQRDTDIVYSGNR